MLATKAQSEDEDCDQEANVLRKSAAKPPPKANSKAKPRPAASERRAAPLAPERVARDPRRRWTKRIPTPYARSITAPWELLVATILSAQCTDVRVNMVTPELFRRFPTPAAMAKATLAGA